ncbi:indolepyruvate oxidoreductase subunit beta family protein [Rhodoferax sediminis]|uniref:Indolepyruvate oxidoreductase subunit beta family protein n=1 Tax=Rhodoferax sediminis TaxID=2509614 RepID=A0A515DCB4_9BURK|nr:indolepyruvate oxidoreductase subunit beta family protein [Rhodoferax sediminis]QDL38061.1 indolepyruvate oxidoreductase subunit beta family protein [Rhodoferax sediminis]
MSDIKPISILVAALGGEGGGVLSDWIISAATQLDFPVQSTSVPGVAQRTGATTYYLEVLPLARNALAGREPIFSLTPTPGSLDIIVASELVEAGRVLQGGYVNTARTTLIASTHREYAISEKTAMGDGRFDTARLVTAAQKMAQRTFLFDMRVLAWKHGTVINTVMFGAMAGTGVLPFPREVCEEAIRESGKAVEASLRGFAAGYGHVTGTGDADVTAPASIQAGVSSIPRRVQQFPEPVRQLVGAGVEHVTDYQSNAYASLYLDRCETICGIESDRGQLDFPVTRETARYLALWMAYEDVVRVADLKTRRERLDRVRKEVSAKEGEPLRLTEYLKPGLDEICSMLPSRLANWTRNRFKGREGAFSVALHMRTDTVSGFLLLCTLRSLRFWRPRSSRYANEQKAIVRWLAAIRLALAMSGGVAHELALSGNLVKGYGETSERGHRNLEAILADFEATGLRDPELLEARVRDARVAALADPEGRTLAKSLGLQPPEPKAKPIRFVRRLPHA